MSAQLSGAAAKGGARKYTAGPASLHRTGAAGRDTAVAVFLPWSLVYLCDLAVKAQWLKYGGFAAAAAAMNRTWETTESFSRLQRLGFYHGDLLITGCLLPVLLIATLYHVAQKWAVLLASLFSILAASTLVTQYSAFSMLGRFADWTVIRTGLQWWLENPSSGSDALVRSYELRLAFVVVAILMLGVAAHTVVPRLSNAARRWMRRLIVVCVCVSAFLGVIGWGTAAKAPLFSRDTLVATTQATLGLDASALDKSVFAMTPQQQFELYRRIANTPPPSHDSYFGRASGFNLLMFVYETTPTRVVDPARESLEDFPNLRRLRDRSLVASQHFTTFPATNLATFAMFSSMYSSEHIGDSVQRPFPALMNILAQDGYETGFYGYVWKGAGDDAMLRNLGFRKLVNSELASTFFERLSEGQLGLEQRIKRDIGPLEQLERDIDRWGSTGQRFAAVYFPQMGHGPWPELTGNPNSSADERARFLARYQDRWIGSLLKDLEQHGLAERTIVIVTADHGVRFHSENSVLPVGKIDAVSYRVPMVMYIPGVTELRRDISWPTSHIDIQPSVLDVLGISTGREWEEGASLWDPHLAQRRTFLLGNEIFGADGYYDNGQYVMEQNQSGNTYVSKEMDFAKNRALPAHGVEAEEARHILREFTSFNAATTLELRNGTIH